MSAFFSSLCRIQQSSLRLGAGLTLILVSTLSLSTPTYGMPQDSPLASNANALIRKATINLSLNNVVGHISPLALGTTLDPIRMDSPTVNYLFRSPEGQAKLTELGLNTFFYSADRNDWNNLYDDFMALPFAYPIKLDTPEMLTLSSAIGAEPVIVANVTNLCRQADPAQAPSSTNVTCQYATPDLTLNWINYLNSQFQAGLAPKVRYVALGVEPYAGCVPWQQGINCTTPKGQHKIILSADQYVTRVNQWGAAIKAIDPTIQIGVHLQPNTFICQGSCKTSWDQTVLQQAKYVDFVMVHQYFTVNQPAASESVAQMYSYYQEQIDIRVLKQGMTAMPLQIRRELLRWAPTKKRIPIFVPEFNATRVITPTGADSDDLGAVFTARQSLYSAFAVGELFLDLLQPVNVGGRPLPGATRAFLHNLYAPPVMIAQSQSSADIPPTMVFTPSWYALAALKDFRGKDILKPVITNNPNTPVRRPALRAYAVKAGKSVWLAVFNHSMIGPVTADIRLRGASPLQATAVEIGRNVPSFLTQNNLLNPTAIVPITSTVAATQLKGWGIQGYTFAPHTVTILQITGQ